MNIHYASALHTQLMQRLCHIYTRGCTRYTLASRRSFSVTCVTISFKLLGFM